MLAILLLAAEKNKATFIAPVGIGIALFVAELWGVGYTGGSLNPARSFGPSVADRQFNGYGESPQVLGTSWSYTSRSCYARSGISLAGIEADLS
jgi:glycerol uptake facilitator-like aquaporin